MSSQLVSVVMPCFNSSEFIEDAIQSVLKQTHRNLELIIIDDCSTDNSVSLIRSFLASDIRVTLLQLSENSGAAIARNKGISKMSGNYLTFLDADDLWDTDFVESSIKEMQKNECTFGFSGYYKMDKNNVVFERFGVPVSVSYKELLKGCSISCLSAFLNVDVLGKRYFPLGNKREDYAYWLGLLKVTDRAIGFDFCKAYYRVYPNQSSAKKISMARENWLLYRNIENLGFFQSLYYFSHYAIRGLLKTKAPTIARWLGLLV